MDETVKGFLDNWGIPQCVGAIDGSHIPVKPPSMNHTDYYNRKGWYSILVQAVVDVNYLFTDLNVGWPRSVHDAHVYSPILSFIGSALITSIYKVLGFRSTIAPFLSF